MASSEQDAVQKSLNDAIDKYRASPEMDGMTTEAANLAAADLRKNLMAGGTTLGWAAGLLVKLGTTLIVKFLSLISKFRAENQEAFAEISKEALSEMFGADFSEVPINLSQGKDASIAAAQQIGNIVHKRLIDEFGGLTPVSDEAGAQNARAFSGFAINFGVQNATIGMLCDAVSSHYLEQFRHIGEESARNLGIGRLQRLALSPLLQTMIAKPYQRYLNTQVRPEILGAGELVKAYYRGGMTRDELSTQLARHGYTEVDIQHLIEDHTPRLSVGDLEMLVRWGEMDEQAAVAHLVASGIPQDTAQLQINSAQYSRRDSIEQETLAILKRQFQHRFIDLPTFTSGVDRLHLSDEEKAALHDQVGNWLETGWKRPSWAEAIKAYHHGACDLTYLQNWLNNEGFDEEDSKIMLAMATQEYKRPPWDEVKKAYEAGQVTMDYVEKWLTDHGYNMEDAQVETYNLLDEQATKVAKAKAAAAKAAAAASSTTTKTA